MTEGRLRGYFGVGVEGISKPMNAGAIMRTAHAFGPSFVFTVGAASSKRAGGRTDTSRPPAHLPLPVFAPLAELRLPRGCDLVGLTLVEAALEYRTSDV